MKLLIIRHGDPDYAKDSLTPRGWREAKLLAGRVAALRVKSFYVSPLGRAKDTASLTLKKMRRRAQELPWLREFYAPIVYPSTGEEHGTWDWLPADWTPVADFYDRLRWTAEPTMRAAHVGDEVKRVYAGLDAVLARHGYEREENIYRAVGPNRDILVFFCHFGVECVMLGHLLGISPFVLWHGLCAAPTSVTTVVTEERRQGVASFRMSSFGDTSHLYAAGEKPAFAGRFCETFDDKEERHD